MLDDAGERGRASTPVAIGTVVGIAVLVVGGLGTWMRLGGSAVATRQSAVLEQEELPTELPAGHPLPELPAVVLEAVEGPVVGALLLDELPQGFPDCADGMVTWKAEPAVRAALLTPDGLSATLTGTGSAELPAVAVGPGAPDGGVVDGQAELSVACEAVWDGAAWQSTGIAGPFPAGQEGLQGSSWGCCDARGRSTVTVSVTPPDNAAWALQERGGYWLAYPVRAGLPLQLRWAFREGMFRPGPPGTHVRYLDADGTQLEEAYVSG